jgi:hypothetical protein
MKLIFKFFIFILLIHSTTGFSREIVLIENLSSIEEGEVVKNILVQKYKIPQELITLKQNESACSKNTESIMHLCIDENGELKVARMNKYVVRNALGVFMKSSEKMGN